MNQYEFEIVGYQLTSIIGVTSQQVSKINNFKCSLHDLPENITSNKAQARPVRKVYMAINDFHWGDYRALETGGNPFEFVPIHFALCDTKL